MKHVTCRNVFLMLCLLVMVMTGCSRSPRVNFYTLAPSAKPEAALQSAIQPAVSIGPITLPEYLDRPQLVVRLEGNQVDILELHRWAEPLKSQIPRMLAENLGILLGSNRISAYPQNFGNDADMRVSVDFQRIESTGEVVTVDALWSIRKAAGGVVTGRTQVRENAGGGGFDPLVAAYNRALVAVSKDLAQAIRSDSASRP